MTAEAVELQRHISQVQNADGGWGYHPGSSWTEPTALAVLALQAGGSAGDVCPRAFGWLRQSQRRDGGWAPHPALDTSTAVTSWAVLALSGTHEANAHIRRGTEWILGQISREPSALRQALCRIFEVPPPEGGGLPWFPGTAAWIAPTVASILALSQVSQASTPERTPNLSQVVGRAQQFILSRQCRDGGWNHGGSPYRSEDAESYPEMTGMALLGLYGASRTDLARPLARAEAYLNKPQSAEALSWLQLGLARHGRIRPAAGISVECRTLRDACLRLLALSGPSASNRLFAPRVS